MYKLMDFGVFGGASVRSREVESKNFFHFVSVC